MERGHIKILIRSLLPKEDRSRPYMRSIGQELVLRSTLKTIRSSMKRYCGMTTTTTKPIRVLAIFAHPDDAEFSIGGSAALWADEGAEVFYCVVTDGAAGSNDPNQNLDELVSIRQAEQLAAAQALGVESYAA